MFFSCIKIDTNISNLLIRILNLIQSIHIELLFLQTIFYPVILYWHLLCFQEMYHGVDCSGGSLFNSNW